MSDINECLQQPQVCPGNQICVNTEGSYDCICPPNSVLVDENCVAGKERGITTRQIFNKEIVRNDGVLSEFDD